VKTGLHPSPHPSPHLSPERPAAPRPEPPAADRARPPAEAPPGPDAGHADTPPEGAVITFEQIRERAYELWERNHKPEGFEIEFWLLAERELRKELERRKSAPAGAPPAEPQAE
jgi:hypothetical protein